MKTTCESFVNILNILHKEGIMSKAALMLKENLYTSFWFAAQDFVNYVLRSKTSGVNENGEVIPGNIHKIEALENRGVAKEDIHSDCVIKIIDKLDLVLKQPLEKQKNYCYRICNNVVNDQFRKLPPAEFEVLSLQDTVKGSSVSAEDACTYEDLIGDDTYNAERMFIEQETISELTAILKEKEAIEATAKREAILKEIALLSKKPAEVLVRMACTHLNMKPRELAKRLVEDGVDYTYANVLLEVSKENGIKVDHLRDAIAGNKLTAESVKAETMDEEIVSAQISRLVYRANKNLNK